jgi:hypothetical protein
MTEPESESQPPPPPEPSPLEPALRAGKLFLWPFMFSMAMAFIGGRRDIDWLYYAGLAGVGLSMVSLFVWLTRA